MRLILRPRAGRFTARPVQISVDFDVTAGVNRVDVLDQSTAYAQITAWAWVLKKGGVQVATSSQQNPSFTGLTAGSDYVLEVTVSSVFDTAFGSFGSFSVDPGALSTPEAPVPGTVSGLTVPLTFSAPDDPSLTLERHLHYANGSAPTTSDPFVTISVDDTDYDFVADAAGTWHFKLRDVAIAPFATDSALSADASAVVSSGGTAPSAPTLDTVAATGAHRLDLSWTIGANIGSGNHNVYRVDGSDTGFTPDSTNRVASELSAATSTYADTTVGPDTQYTYKVEAINGSGQAFSSGVSQTTPAQGAWPDNEPPGLTVFVNADGSVKNMVPGALYSPQWQTGLMDDGVTPRVSVITDASSKHGSVVRKRFEIGDTSGFNGKFTKANLANASLREIFYRMVFKLSANYQFHSGHEKLFYWGTRNTGNIPFALFLLGSAGGTSKFQLDFSYNNNQCTHSPAGRRFRTINTLISVDVWNTVELYCVAQSAPGAADGSVQLWSNDVEVTDWQCIGQNNICSQLNWVPGVSTFTNFDLVPACAIHHLYGSIEAPLYFGGSNQGAVEGWTKQVQDYIDISELYISGLI